MKNDTYSPASAARRLEVTLAHIYNLIWAGKLEATQEAGKWKVSHEAVEARRKTKLQTLARRARPKDAAAGV